LPTVTTASCQQITARLENELKQVHNSGYNKAKLNTDYFKPYVEQALKKAKQLDNNLSARWPNQVGIHVYKVVDQLVKNRL
jgi:hypothetical protein